MLLCLGLQTRRRCGWRWLLLQPQRQPWHRHSVLFSSWTKAAEQQNCLFVVWINIQLYKSERLTNYVQARIRKLYSDGQDRLQTEMSLNIYETVCDQKCHEAQAEACSKRRGGAGVKRTRTHARRLHYDIIIGSRYSVLSQERSTARRWLTASPRTRLARYRLSRTLTRGCSASCWTARTEYGCEPEASGFSTEVMWSRGPRFIRRRAVAFWTRCSEAIVAIGRRARLELP